MNTNVALNLEATARTHTDRLALQAAGSLSASPSSRGVLLSHVDQGHLACPRRWPNRLQVRENTNADAAE